MRRAWQMMLLAVGVAFLASPACAEDYLIVVHPSVEGTKIERSVLASIYQKDVIRWGNQVRIRPVDQSSQTPIRLAFTRDILGRSLGEVQSFWTNRMATERELPPPSKATDEDVLAFVASKTGAIGYVSAETDILPGVKVIRLVD